MIETKHYLSLAVAQTQEMFITSIVISCPGFCFIGTMFFSMKRDIMLQNTSSESSITVIKAQIDGLLRLIIHFDQQNFFDLQKKKKQITRPTRFPLKRITPLSPAES